MRQGTDGSKRLALEEDGNRLLALLSVLKGYSVSIDVLRTVEAVSNDWERGDKALANIRLAQANLPKLADSMDAYRLLLAEDLLDKGTSPRALMKALGFDTAHLDLTRYDQNQPRVPAGNGRESGRWGSGGGQNTVRERDAFMRPAPAIAARFFLAEASPSAIRALASFATRFSVPTAILGALLIPTPNSGGVISGTLPDAPDIKFRKDGPTGTLRLTAKAADGSDIVVRAQNHAGLYVDVRTGQGIGRDLGERLYLNSDAVQNAIHSALAPGQRYQPDPESESKNDDPKLCPDPVPDRGHGSSERAKDYEDDVHARVNPLAPIPRGFAVALPDPKTGKLVYFEDCFRDAGDLVDKDMAKGDLAEGKGLGREWLLDRTEDMQTNMREEFLDQAERQTNIARARGVGLKWYFADARMADYARRLFEDRFPDIVIAVMPPRSRK